MPQNRLLDETTMLPFLGSLADAAASITLQAFRKSYTTENKLDDGGFDPVTEADRDAEAAIRAILTQHYPEHGIEGEEYGIEREDAPWRWILDPIDGTRAFISGLPTWGTLIALTYEGYPVYGVIDQPYLGERYIGGPKGSWLNGNPLKARACTSLSDSTMTTTDADLFTPSERPFFETLKQTVKLTRYGLDCYGYAMVASGHMDLVVESGLKRHDMAALIPVIEGAGGWAGDWSGKPALEEGNTEGRLIAVGDPALKDWVLAALGEQ